MSWEGRAWESRCEHRGCDRHGPTSLECEEHAALLAHEAGWQVRAEWKTNEILMGSPRYVYWSAYCPDHADEAPPWQGCKDHDTWDACLRDAVSLALRDD